MELLKLDCFLNCCAHNPFASLRIEFVGHFDCANCDCLCTGVVNCFTLIAMNFLKFFVDMVFTLKIPVKTQVGGKASSKIAESKRGEGKPK